MQSPVHNTSSPSQIDDYQSPFTVRYAGPVMRALWSERHKRLLWRRVWLALAEAQHELGIVRAEQLADLRAHAEEVTEASIARALEIEREIHHDLMAEVRAFAEQCPVGGGIIHLGATSMDIEDNADALRLREALDEVLAGLARLIAAFADKVEQYADTPCMAFTHLQPAEPTTIGYRLAQHLQDLLTDLEHLRRLRADIKGKGFKGAVGTSASYLELTGEAQPTANEQADAPTHPLEKRVLAKLGLEAFPVATQTYPRKQDWLVVNGLASVAQSLYKFAFDLRVLQSPPIGEWAEPFGAKQVGSSAMPFKRNPIQAEKIDSLARYIAALPRVLWDNAAHSLLERTLDDSANRRVVLSEAFLATDEIIRTAERIVSGLRVNERHAASTMQRYGPFAATERLLMALVKAGADRQAMHERIREHSLAAWAAMNAGQSNPLIEYLCADPHITHYIDAAKARALLDADDYVGDAPRRARSMAALARAALGPTSR
ncbi:MAG: adenylosuccinate lyase [Anaerolineae bacterium]|nr:adenylosuccinate lyase [Thermoflexales bacterium]MDW8407454.1 adenylosuccinate lyase [Anaerolineae bacterium]